MEGTFGKLMPTQSNFGSRGTRYPSGGEPRLVPGGLDRPAPASVVTEWELHAFVDNALDRNGASRVAAYLAARPDEAARVEAYRRQNVALALLYRSAPLPPPLFAHLPDQVAAEISRRRHARILARIVGIALMLLLVTCVALWALT